MDSIFDIILTVLAIPFGVLIFILFGSLIISLLSEAFTWVKDRITAPKSETIRQKSRSLAERESALNMRELALDEREKQIQAHSSPTENELYSVKKQNENLQKQVADLTRENGSLKWSLANEAYTEKEKYRRLQKEISDKTNAYLEEKEREYAQKEASLRDHYSQLEVSLLAETPSPQPSVTMDSDQERRQFEADLSKAAEEYVAKVKSEVHLVYSLKQAELKKHYEQKERDFDLWRKQKEQQLNAEHDALRLEMARISGETAEIEQSFLQLEHIENQISSSLVSLFGQKVITNLINATTTKSFLRGLEGDFKLTSPITFDEVTIESDGVPYDVSLISCNCPSKQRPCKHMIWLALNLGALHFNPNDQKKILDRIAESATAYQSVIEQTKKDQDSLKKDKKKLKDERRIIESEKYTHPELGQLLAEYEKCIDENRERMLPCNALKSAEIVSAIKKEKQKLIKEKNLYFSKVTVYESLFPWLVECKDMTMDDVRRLGEETSKHEDYVTFLRFWLTPEEFTVLSPSEKIQLALKRSKK